MAASGRSHHVYQPELDLTGCAWFSGATRRAHLHPACAHGCDGPASHDGGLDDKFEFGWAGERAASGISPRTKKFFCKSVLHTKATPFMARS